MRNIITMNKDYTLITIVINMILMLNITTITTTFTRMLANLRNMALDMNAEIRDQNEQMDRITEKVKFYSILFLECNKKYDHNIFKSKHAEILSKYFQNFRQRIR